MAGFQRLKYHVADDPEESGTARAAISFRAGPDPRDAPVGPFDSDEKAAEFFLKQLLLRDGRPSMRSFATPDEAQEGASVVVSSKQDLPATGSHLVRFTQISGDIPVFGAEAVVELDRRRNLVSADVRLGDVPDIGTSPTYTVDDAISAIAELVGTAVAAGELPPASREWFQDPKTSTWHLTWHVRDVPALPPEARADPERAGHGIGDGFRARHVHADYLVDVHTCAIVYYFSTSPTVGVPTKCVGTDEDDQHVEFYGAKMAAAFALHDPLRRVSTFNLALADIDKAIAPADPVVNATAQFGLEHRAAVTAHLYGALVQDFYRSVLQRNGIDDSGMELVSVVNCSCAADQPPPEWRNACWWNKRMWYGQVDNSTGRSVSMARYLDIMAHEITHGVIESSSKLVYRDESGALNESFADVFGVIIANWYRAPVRNDVTTWDWLIGAGLRDDGGPLRNFADPASLGDPAHMDDFVHTKSDSGGVHTNSNIHNKAVHNLLTAVGPDAPILSVQDAATILYLALVQLPNLASFSDVKEKAVDVAKVYFAGDINRSKEVCAAIAAAYSAVGIG